MMHLNKKLFFSIFILIFVNLTFATNYYVDRDANGANSGTSWGNAWESFADINWSQIQPDDIIYISGGTSSKVYNEQLTIGTSGNASGLITIRSGLDAGHNGRVILDGNNTLSRGILISGNKYLRIADLEIQNYSTEEGYVYIDEGSSGSNVIYLDSLIITELRGRGIKLNGHPDYHSIDSVFIRYCNITASINIARQTDCIYFQYAENTYIDGNVIILTNNSPNEHADCIQAAYTGNFTIRNNHLYNSRGSGEYSQGIILQAQKSNTTEILYNNVVYCPNMTNTTAVQIGHYDESNIGLYIYGNTIYHNGEKALTVNNPNAIVRNNIFSGNSGNGTIKINEPLNNNNQFSNNLYWNRSGGSNVIQHTSYGPTSLTEWQNHGGGSGSYSSNPNFHNVGSQDFTIDDPSDAFDNGIGLGAPYNKDIIGTLRPQGSGWDIGAYEMTSRFDITPPEVTGATLLDSVTLKVIFSEVLDETTAEDENNYSITNNIDIINASLSGSEVTLQTSVHSPDIYTVTVTNVTDLAGNSISPQANSADYEMSHDPPTELIELEIVDANASVNPESNHHPLKAIDGSGYYEGDQDSRWAGDTMPEWLCFDLGFNKNVSLTKLEFYNWHGGRIYDFSIQLSEDNTNWTTVVSNASSDTEQWTINEFTAMEARYVKIVFNSSNQNSWAGLWEGEVWGYNTTNEITPGIFPEEFELSQNYPNPFNPSTKIKFTIPDRANVVLKVFNSLGQEIIELVNADMDSGVYEFEFNANGLASGIYIYRMTAGNFFETKKMIFMK